MSVESDTGEQVVFVSTARWHQDNEHVLVLESGILSPNDQARGSLVQYDFSGHDSLRFNRILIGLALYFAREC